MRPAAGVHPSTAPQAGGLLVLRGDARRVRGREVAR